MKTWINSLLEGERDEFLGRDRHARLDQGHDNYRNGYRPRRINFFGLGEIELKVPRDRQGEFTSQWLPERKGQDPELEAFLAEAFLAGLSTRDLARISEKHLAHKYDSKQISRIVPQAMTGLEAIFQRFFPRSQTQRCQKHAKANACRRVRKQERELFSKDLNAIFYAPTQSAARAAFFTLKQQWGRLFPSAVQIIEKDLDSLLTFFQFDPTYWTVLRTTNPIERLNKEFKRRTNAMEVTGGEISTYRCLAYVAQTMEYRWSFHPLSQWSTVYTLNAAWPTIQRTIRWLKNRCQVGPTIRFECSAQIPRSFLRSFSLWASPVPLSRRW